ncbi:MAG: hypothetical protein IPM74_11935 [Crocinitomicaceae bacterium]|nr:hypothetical protein [Crocinitomicaceae bacterium]
MIKTYNIFKLFPKDALFYYFTEFDSKDHSLLMILFPRQDPKLNADFYSSSADAVKAYETAVVKRFDLSVWQFLSVQEILPKKINPHYTPSSSEREENLCVNFSGKLSLLIASSLEGGPRRVTVFRCNNLSIFLNGVMSPPANPPSREENVQIFPVNWFCNSFLLKALFALSIRENAVVGKCDLSPTTTRLNKKTL